MENSLCSIDKIIENSRIYLEGYPALIKIGQNTAATQLLSQKMLALAVYGWMPTIPKSFFDDPYIKDVRGIRSHDCASKYVKSLQTPLVNNSWIGTSKILHFINPNHFPIWDSRIGGIFGVTSYKMKHQNIYVRYVQKIHQADSENPDAYKCLADKIFQSFNYLPTSIRCIELDLFENGTSSLAFELIGAL